MSAFIGKLLHWLAGEALVKALANNRAFQRFALTTDTYLTKNINNLKKTGDEVLKNVSKTSEQYMSERNKAGTTVQGNDFFTKFINAFGKEIKKDFKPK